MESSPRKDHQLEWFGYIERVYRLSEQAVIDCADSCDGACETHKPETVLFLPYELEYILDQVGLDEDPFQTIGLPSGRYGMMDYHRNCPFLIYKGCGIRPYRPFDCRSFPIYPRFSDPPHDPLEFYLAPYCPLKGRLGSTYTNCIVESWRILLPHLPWDWKAHYNSLCHYQERLFPTPP